MRSIKFKKTFVFRVALASVLSLLMSFSSMCYMNNRMVSLEARLQTMEAASQVTSLSDLSQVLESLMPSTATAEDQLRAAQEAGKDAIPQMSECTNDECSQIDGNWEL